MASFEKLQDRLTALQETTNQVKELIQRLATIKFQPGSVPLPKSISSANLADDNDPDYSDENNVATELTAEISQILREEEEELELLQEEVIDIPSASPGSDAHHRKNRLKETVQRLESEIRLCHSSFRKAQLSARNNLLAAQRLERQLLLSALSPPQPASPVLSGTSSPTTASAAPVPTSPTSPQPPSHSPTSFKARLHRHKSTKSTGKQDQGVNASTDVTEALRRTHNLITAELSKSAFARQTLAESTEALKELNKNYEGIDSLLSKSKTLVGTLLKSQKSDTWYLQSAFYILLFTLVWLVFRRFLYGPLWWVVWLPIRTVFRTGKAVSGAGKSVQESSGARMGILGGEREGYTIVPMAQEGAIPTVIVDGEEVKKKDGKRKDEEEEEEETLVEKVERIIDDNLRHEDNESEAGGEDPGYESKEGDQSAAEEEEYRPNPKKRMWEENIQRDEQGNPVLSEPDVDERVRDEL